MEEAHEFTRWKGSGEKRYITLRKLGLGTHQSPAQSLDVSARKWPDQSRLRSSDRGSIVRPVTLWPDGVGRTPVTYRQWDDYGSTLLLTGTLGTPGPIDQ